jgi:molecular chaperone DnaJ
MCRVVVETPVKLTSRQKELLGEFDAALKGGDESSHAPRATSWFNGVKRFFEDMR